MSCILSANTVTLPEEFDQDQLSLNLGVASVADVIIHGQITDCETEEPIIGAIIKAFDEIGEGICHTFSGCDGFYMLRISTEFAGQTITIAATCTNCPEPLEPCECPEEPTND